MKFREDDDIELQALCLVDGHYPNSSIRRRLHGLALDEPHEIVGPERRPGIPPMGQLEKLAEASQITVVHKRLLP